MAKSAFKQEHPFENRQAKATWIREKYPNKIPVIVEKHQNSDLPDIERKRYLVPGNICVGTFAYVIRQKMKLSAEKAIVLFVENVLPPTAALMSEIYLEHKDKDGLLYMTYSSEKTFEMAKSAFKQEHPFEWRRGENIRIREKYPGRIPVIVEKRQNSDLPDIERKKCLTPGNLTVGRFLYVIRQRLKPSAEKDIFVLVKNVLPPSAALMSEIYHKHKDEDGFLYMTYSEMAKSAFKQTYPFEWRRGEKIRIREKYPDRIPVIVEKHQNSDLPDIEKKKYLVPGNICVGKFACVIRQQIKLSAEKALFLFVENVLPPTRSFKQFLKAFIACKIKNSVCSSDSLYICDTAALMSEIYHKHKDEDGFLYVTYSGKKTLGSP